MSATIIEFPRERIARHAEVIHAIETLNLIDAYELSGDPIKAAIAPPMRQYWEEELARLGGVSPAMLRKDGEAER